MPQGLEGDFAGLAAVIGELEGMADLVGDICVESSAEIEQAIDSQFTLGTDPYGKAWAPLKASTLKRHPHRHDPPLTDTGAMRSSVTVQATMDFIGVTIADPAGYHQDGTDHMVSRPIIPSDARGIPPAWEAAIRDAGMRVIDRRWGQ